MTSERRVRAFTLVELMIVVVIIGILASVLLVKYGPVSEKARSAEAYSALALIVSAENVYQLDHGSYTTTIGDLDVDIPASSNFTFTVPTTTYAKATHAGTNTIDYCMNLDGGSKITCP